MKIEKKPTSVPGKSPKSVASGKVEVSMPGEMPPASIQNIVSAEGIAPTMAGMSDAAPSLQVIEGVGGIAAWQNNKQITALWSINQNVNSWVGVSGIGWKKLSNASGSGIVALTMLAAHAREKGSVVNYREESDGMIHEMYVW
jgi:hypothetical protein